MMKRGKVLLGGIVGLAIGFAAWLGYIGYLGGQLYFDIPARADANAVIGDPSSARSRTVAVIFSGDMGFRVGQGPQIAWRIANDGIPVEGVSSLVHFRYPRTEAQVRDFIVASIRRALARTRADRLILIGQSFGADMLQVGVTGLPADLRAKVQTLVLIVPGDSLIFRASPSELFNWMPPDASALPTARQLTWAPVLCVHGAEEIDSLCPLLNMPNVRIVALPGGHAMHHDIDAVYATIRAQIEETRKRP